MAVIVSAAILKFSGRGPADKITHNYSPNYPQLITITHKVTRNYQANYPHLPTFTHKLPKITNMTHKITHNCSQLLTIYTYLCEVRQVIVRQESTAWQGSRAAIDVKYTFPIHSSYPLSISTVHFHFT